MYSGESFLGPCSWFLRGRNGQLRMVIAAKARCKEQQVSVLVKFLNVTGGQVDCHPETRVLCGSKDQCKSTASCTSPSLRSGSQRITVNPETTMYLPAVTPSKAEFSSPLLVPSASPDPPWDMTSREIPVSRPTL